MVLFLEVGFGVLLSFIFLWVVMGVCAESFYWQMNHDKGEIQKRPLSSYFYIRGPMVLYKIFKNPEVNLNHE